jgi:hypothetical protein
MATSEVLLPSIMSYNASFRHISPPIFIAIVAATTAKLPCCFFPFGVAIEIALHSKRKQVLPQTYMASSGSYISIPVYYQQLMTRTFLRTAALLRVLHVHVHGHVHVVELVKQL